MLGIIMQLDNVNTSSNNNNLSPYEKNIIKKKKHKYERLDQNLYINKKYINDYTYL